MGEKGTYLRKEDNRKKEAFSFPSLVTVPAVHPAAAGSGGTVWWLEQEGGLQFRRTTSRKVVKGVPAAKKSRVDEVLLFVNETMKGFKSA